VGNEELEGDGLLEESVVQTFFQYIVREEMNSGF